MDALVAYLQMLGTLVDFTIYDDAAEHPLRRRTMDSTYRALRQFAQTLGPRSISALVFLGIVVCALRPGAQAAVRRQQPAFPSRRTEPMADEATRTSTPITGTATTGHEWDGIKELNKPLPRWWLWIFYATIVWSVGYGSSIRHGRWSTPLHAGLLG